MAGVTVMKDALRKGTWDMSCTVIMFFTSEHPNNSISFLLTQAEESIATEKFDLSHGDLNSNIDHRNTMLYH